jgi:tripartite-type tricarboxylate transporter receptor subunit TctC
MARPRFRSSGMSRIRVFAVTLLALSLFAPGRPSSAASPAAPPYPSKAITLICPFAPGGSSDLAVRPLANYLSKKWGQAVSVVNKVGASGTTGTVQALQSAPDGYTVYVAGSTNGSINPALEKDLPYKWDQPTTLGRIVVNPVAVIVKADSKWQTVKELLADIAKDPKKFKLGTSAPAGPSTLSLGQLLDGAGIDITQPIQVIFQGGAAAVNAVAGGHVDFASQGISEVMALVDAKKIRALVVSSSVRMPQLPQVPTGKEAGVPWFNWVGYTGILGPAGLPEYVTRKWAEDVNTGLQDNEVTKVMHTLGAIPAFQAGPDFKAFLKGDYELSDRLIRKLGIAAK